MISTELWTLIPRRLAWLKLSEPGISAATPEVP
jgi:hypothetical protein